MGSLSPVHWLILGVIVLVIFGGGGKISGLMGDFAKGIKSFKKNMAEDENLTPPGSDSGAKPAPGPIPPPVQSAGFAQTAAGAAAGATASKTDPHSQA